MSQNKTVLWLKDMFFKMLKNTKFDREWRREYVRAMSSIPLEWNLADEDIESLKKLVYAEKDPKVKCKLIELLIQDCEPEFPDRKLVQVYCESLVEIFEDPFEFVNQDMRTIASVLSILHSVCFVPWDQIVQFLHKSEDKSWVVDVLVSCSPLEWAVEDLDKLGDFGRMLVDRERVLKRKEIFFRILSIVYPVWREALPKRIILEKFRDTGDIYNSIVLRFSGCMGDYEKKGVISSSEQIVLSHFISEFESFVSKNSNCGLNSTDDLFKNPTFVVLCEATLRELVGDRDAIEVVSKLP